MVEPCTVNCKILELVRKNAEALNEISTAAKYVVHGMKNILQALDNLVDLLLPNNNKKPDDEVVVGGIKD